MHLEKLKHYQTRAEVFFKLLQRDFIKESANFEAEHFVTDEPVAFAEINKYTFKPVTTGEIWGKNWQCAWFRLKAQVPGEWAGGKVVARLNIGGEGLIFSADGEPLQGITDSSIFWANFIRDLFPLYDRATGGEKVELLVDSAANNYFGQYLDNHPRLDTDQPYGYSTGKVAYMQLCVLDEEMWQLMLDVEVALSLLKTYKKEDYRYRQILMLINEAADILKGERTNAGAARDFLKKRFFSSIANSSALTATAVGHAHIDTGWLWPVRETIRKCGRTFANQLALIEKYPGYVFGASQPQHYQFVKDSYPELYKKIKQAVAAGSWEPQGGMWVEADCNLISGESMIRQFLHGKNFFMDEFGFDVKNLWIPDVFGYSAAMPQIIKGSGCDYFLTQKISWNIFNNFPHHTFMWRGIDGSRVLTHFPPENNYNARMLPEELSAGQNRFAEADAVNEFISLFGIGDGGGGPREDYIERALRLRNLEGCPKVKMGRADDFFERLSNFEEKLDVWDGELYLEKHQGTLTSQAKTKKANRKLEYLLKHVEFIYSCLPLTEYPAEKFDRMWKMLLINQFHDIIPGSSITRVYKEAAEQYEEIFTICRELLNNAADKLFEKADDCMVMFNPLGCNYCGQLELPDGWNSASVDGKPLQCQAEKNQVIAEICIPAYSFITLQKVAGTSVKAGGGNELTLENDLIRYEFDANGKLVRAYDKEAGHEIITQNAPANVLSVYHDDPVEYDAWDIDLSYENQHLEDARGISAAKTVDGALRQIIEFKLKISNSTIKQQVVLGNGKRLDFHTEIEWSEAHRMLRASFPVEVHATEATFDIQYGYIKRFAGRNTSWDMARYEVPAHRYVDISDSQYGVTLLNDCKYGHKVFERTLELTVLRSPKYPDFEADMGNHTLTYSLLPHTGGMLDSDVMNNAAILNQPPLRFNGFKATAAVLPCSLNTEDISLEVIKKAEKEDCLVIRLVETKGRRSKGVISFNKIFSKAVRTNLIEWTNEEDLDISSGNLKIELKPFEIRTYKVY
ncbi:MAG: glycoside hydrolase family 38 C-terminal domain-containing protein [Victivallaceae bacterium]